MNVGTVTWRARCDESRTSGSEGGPGRRMSRNARTAPRARPYYKLDGHQIQAHPRHRYEERRTGSPGAPPVMPDPRHPRRVVPAARRAPATSDRDDGGLGCHLRRRRRLRRLRPGRATTLDGWRPLRRRLLRIPGQPARASGRDRPRHSRAARREERSQRRPRSGRSTRL